MSLLQSESIEQCQLVMLPERQDWCVGVGLSVVSASNQIRRMGEFPALHIWTAKSWTGGPVDVLLNKTGGSEAFTENHCESCKYYFDTDDYEDEDSDGNRIVATLHSACDAYRNGCVESCIEGHEFNPDEVEEVELPPYHFIYPLVSQAGFSEAKIIPFNTILAEMASLCLEPDGALSQTIGQRAPNTYSDRTVCWGADDPSDFETAILETLSSTFNEDLIKIDEITRNISSANSGKTAPVAIDILWHESHSTQKPSAVAFIEKYLNPKTYLMLRAMGLQSADLPVGGIALLLDKIVFDGQHFMLSRSQRPCVFALDGSFLGQAPQNVLSSLAAERQQNHLALCV